jgi:hypothetical protein
MKYPDCEVRSVAMLLVKLGFSLSEEDVRRRLRSLASGPSPDLKLSRRARRKERAAESVQRRWAKAAITSTQPRVDTCPSCGVPVSDRGRCRCS